MSLVNSVIEEGFLPIVAGHSLGGYWALNVAQKVNATCVLINPQLFPDNEDIRDLHLYATEIVKDNPKYMYLERGDEVVDVNNLIEFTKDAVYALVVNGGHHRVEHLHNINNIIEIAIKSELK